MPLSFDFSKARVLSSVPLARGLGEGPLPVHSHREASQSRRELNTRGQWQEVPHCGHQTFNMLRDARTVGSTKLRFGADL